MDRAKFPVADDEYTPAERKVVDARLAKAEQETRAGQIHGPFKTAEDMIASMKAELTKRAVVKTRRSR